MSTGSSLKAAFEQYPRTGISVLVVGGGIAGLAFSIEAKRKGHDVRVIERRPTLDDFGDLIGIQSPVLHTMGKWPGFLEGLKSMSWPSLSHWKKYDGSPIGAFPIGDPELLSIPLNRQGFHTALYEYALELGVSVQLSAAAEEYFETSEHGGVLLADGNRLTADLVVAADGIGSRSRLLVFGKHERPISSGFAVYRASFPIKPVMESNPIIAREFDGFDKRVSIHLGPDAHVVIGKTQDDICWMLNHKDHRAADEGGLVQIASSDDALKHVEGWTPFISELIKSTPNKAVVDWKLMWRDPQLTWASPNSRVIQIGDAAHPFLPTSGSGATMGIEDGFSLATCLQLSGRENAQLGVKVHNRLRFERVACAQKMGFKIREAFHKTDWDAVAKNPEIVGRAVGNWVLKHNPEQYALEKYGSCADHLIAGTAFENTNMPPGYVFKPWTVKELLDQSDNGGIPMDEGDWS